MLERLSQGGIVSALASLPQQYRDTVVLVDLADFSYQDAAESWTCRSARSCRACTAGAAC